MEHSSEYKMEKSLEYAKLSYDPQLLTNLKKDHRILLNQMHSLSEAAKSKDLEHLPLLLDIFRSTMLAHVSQEIIKLYVYLLGNLPHDLEQYKHIRTFRKEMDAILIDILNFLDTYKDVEKIEQGQNFQNDLKQIIDMFSLRIEKEENILFPLYAQIPAHP